MNRLTKKIKLIEKEKKRKLTRMEISQIKNLFAAEVSEKSQRNGWIIFIMAVIGFIFFSFVVIISLSLM